MGRRWELAARLLLDTAATFSHRQKGLLHYVAQARAPTSIAILIRVVHHGIRLSLHLLLLANDLLVVAGRT